MIGEGVRKRLILLGVSFDFAEICAPLTSHNGAVLMETAELHCPHLSQPKDFEAAPTLAVQPRVQFLLLDSYTR